MQIRIYQIDLFDDTAKVCFEGSESLKRIRGTDKVNPEDYMMVYEADVPCGDLEEVYTMFNIDHPDDYNARSMSVSDVVEDVDEGKFYFCDSFGWKEIEFDSSKIRNLEKKIKVVLCELGKEAEIVEIGASLHSMQSTVGGYIESFFPFTEEVCIVCNEEGKFNGSLPCRRVLDDNGNIMDVIYGTFFICDCSGEDFDSLSDEQAEKYREMFLRW